METLLEVVEDAANIEMVICTDGNKFDNVDQNLLETLVKNIKAEREAEEAKKNKK